MSLFNFIASTGDGTYEINIDHTLELDPGVASVDVGVKDKGNLAGAIDNLATVVKGIAFIA